MPRHAHDPATPDTPDAPDAFDTWLDALFTSPPSYPPDATTQVETDASPEASAARDLRILAAQTDAITLPAHSWKEILMASQHPTPNAPMPIPGNAHRTPTRLGATLNRIVSIAAILAIVFAGIATAWVSRDRLGFGDDEPLLQLAASPTTVVTCTTRTLSQEEVDRIVAKYQPQLQFSRDSLTPTNNPVAEADAFAAIETFRADQSCPAGDPSANDMRWLHSTESESSLAIRNLPPVERLTEYKPMLEALSRMLVPPPSSSYVVDSADPAVIPYVINVVGSGTFALLPTQFVQFPDGSIGAPLVRAIAGGASSGKDYSKLTVQFVIFSHVNGRWLIGGYLPWLCPEDCSAAQGLLDQQIAQYQLPATAESSPVASPAASPEATITCTTRTLSQEEADRIAAAYRAQPESTSADYMLSDTPVPAADANAAIAILVAALSCPNGEPGSNSLLWQRSTYTDGYFAGSYLTTSPAWMAEYLARWKAELEPMSRILTPLTPADYIVDSNDPAIQRYLISSPYLGTYAVLPDRFVAFADGRIGVPMLLAIPGGAPAYDGYIATLMVPFAIFEKVDGQWLSDGATGLCPGDCSQAEARIDAQIANYQRLATVIGSPVASPAASPEATPAS